MRALAKECRRVNGCVPQRARAAPHLLTIVLPVMRLDIETAVLIVNKYTHCAQNYTAYSMVNMIVVEY